MLHPARPSRFALRPSLLPIFLACANLAQACSSCARPDQGDGATARGAYYWTAIAMTLLPGVLVVTLVRWLRRKGLGDGPPSP